ncbi:MAG: branched-chain amino acid ABC transporter permease [Desulfobacterales bacterium]|nr:MAG: branched-chain amino acid ABC transporter permease [Desulfobacterales bacterium]
MLLNIFPQKSFGVSVGLFILLLIAPAIIPKFYTYILAVIFVTALLAMSLNLVVGHGGLFQFHHGVFYGVGAYVGGLILAKTSLPWWVAFIAGPIAAAVTGFLIGLFCIRLNRLYFGMLQISLGSLLWVIAFRWYDLTGGDDGIHGIPIPEFISSSKSSYYLVLIILCICLILLYLILKSPFGSALQAIRDNPERCAAVGINVRRHQLAAIVIATFFAGVAGILFVVVEGSIFPELLFWVLSLEIFIMCLLGGWFTFAGPILGAAVIVSLRTFVGTYTEYWTLILGVILILLIFFLPEGLMGYNFLAKFRSWSKRAAASSVD